MAQDDPYRGQAARCPGCGETMNTRTVEGSVVDCCERCGGAWLDWFDGSPPQIARSLDDASVASTRPASEATRECPRCRAQLEEEAFQRGPTVSRCGVCYGLFVPRESVRELARMEPPDAPEDKSAFRSLITRIRAIFGDE